MEMLKIGVAGAGHLGKIHIRILKNLDTKFNLVGFYDSDPDLASEVEAEFGIRAFNSIEELINNIDCLDVVTATLSHFEVAKLAAQSRKHIFIEKPLTETIEEAQKLQRLVLEADILPKLGMLKGLILHLRLHKSF